MAETMTADELLKAMGKDPKRKFGAEDVHRAAVAVLHRMNDMGLSQPEQRRVLAKARKLVDS